jgi:hypothetical protein
LLSHAAACQIAHSLRAGRFVDKFNMATPIATKKSGSASTEASAAPPLWGKVLISILVSLHVAAIVAPPLAFIGTTRSGSSPAAESIAKLLQPYSSALYLNHGYAFFAPDPGPNHLVDYKVEVGGGGKPIEGRFPNLREERPRLLYHRYFMLSEALNNRFAPPEYAPEPSPPPLTATPGEREAFGQMKAEYEQNKSRWQHARHQYEAMRSSIEDHLKHQYEGTSVKLTRIEHRPAEPEEVLHMKRRLDAAESYREMPETMPAGGGR